MPRRLNDREIAEYLLEDIPSGSESICSDDDDEYDTEDQPNPLVLGDLIEEVLVTDYDDFDCDDHLPLSSLARRNPDSTESNTVDSNRPRQELQNGRIIIQWTYLVSFLKV